MIIASAEARADMGPDKTLHLLERWRTGDHEALDVLLHRDLEWIRRYVHRHLGGELRRFGDTMPPGDMTRIRGTRNGYMSP